MHNADATYSKVLRVFKITETESGLMVAGAGGGAHGELLSNGCRVSVLQNEKGSGDGAWGWLQDDMNVLHAMELHT